MLSRGNLRGGALIGWDTPDFAPPSRCSNGILDGDETDVDCGGSCTPCGTDQACKGASDCASGICVNRRCAAPTCTDTVKNGTESDVDCGGSCMTKCAEGKRCNDGPDCASLNCVNGTCAMSPCQDGMLDGMETDVDCGGPVCTRKCADGAMCVDGTDCASAMCVNERCKSNCPAGTADCDGDPGNGCETNTNTDAKNCGSCNRVCPMGAPSCANGICVVAPVANCGDMRGLQPGAPWPMLGYCPTHQGRSPYIGAQTAKVRWTFETGDVVQGSGPAISANGTVFVGSYDKRLYALDGATGAKKWAFATGGTIASSPALTADGSVVISSDQIYLLDGANGTKKWSYPAPSDSSPAIGADGTIYIGSSDRNLYALDGATGRKKWTFSAGDVITSAPAVGTDGMIYVGSYDKKLHAVDAATGQQQWAWLTKDFVASPPALLNALVYFGSGDHVIYSVAGNLAKWSFQADGTVLVAAAIARDGTVVVASQAGTLYTLDGANGNLRRAVPLAGGGGATNSVIGADATIYVGSQDTMFALDGSTGKEKWHFKTGGLIASSPAIAADGTVCFGSNDRNVYAIGP